MTLETKVKVNEMSNYAVFNVSVDTCDPHLIDFILIRRSYMSAHDLLNLLNELGEK